MFAHVSNKIRALGECFGTNNTFVRLFTWKDKIEKKMKVIRYQKWILYANFACTLEIQEQYVCVCDFFKTPLAIILLAAR